MNLLIHRIEKHEADVLDRRKPWQLIDDRLQPDMPAGDGFIDYPTFETGYQPVARRTDAFAALTSDSGFAAVGDVPVAFSRLYRMHGQ